MITTPYSMMYSFKTTREKYLLISLAILMVSLLIYYVLFLPIIEKKRTLTQHIQDTQALLVWMKPSVAHLVEARSQFSGVAILDKTQVEKHILELIQREPIWQNIIITANSDKETIVMSFAQMRFDPFVDSLQQNNAQWGWQIIAFDVNKESTPGWVNGQITLKQRVE